MATEKTPTTTTMTDQTTSPDKPKTIQKSTNANHHEKPKTNSDQQTNTQIHSTKQINTTTDNSNPIQSSQPRFSTSDIVKKFPHIKHRYCHKIKISVPWDDKTNPPTLDTYYTSIHYFFKLVKNYDDQFKILTWDIVNKKCETISDPSRLPKSHKELSYYLYNVHMTPSRVRASMVVHSSYNLGDLIHRRYQLNKTQLELLQTFRQEKLWVQPTTVQTMGEIKLIGFLQFVHPKYTNLKKLTLELQAIVETRDISVEIYRPRAIDEKGNIITAPEAIAIGAPSDISIDVYKSLINRWPEVIDGDYDMVIGKESTLKMGYFIPFNNGILNRKDKNEAIINHERFLKDFTSVKIKYCSSVDIRFQMTQSEMSILDLYGKDKQPGEKTKTTLRRILNSWSIETDPHFLVQSIEQNNATTQLLVVKKQNKSEVLTRLHQLINTLKKRKDFSDICGNSDGSKATIDKFVFTKTGYNYLTYLKGHVRPSDPNLENNDDDTIDDDDTFNSDGKRKFTSIRTSSHHHSYTKSISPQYKKSTDISTPPRDQSDNETESSTPTTKNTTKHSTRLKGYADAVKANPPYFDHLPPTKSKLVALPKNTSHPFLTNNQHLSHRKPPLIVDNNDDATPLAPRHVVPYVNVENTELTISTMTPDIIKGYEPRFDEDSIANKHMMSQLTTQHVHDITLAVSHKYEKKYESMMNTMQEHHNRQINNLISTQQSQANEIASIKDSQGTIKSDLELQIHEKMEKQTMVLSSLVEIVQNMQNKDREFYANNSNGHQSSNITIPVVPEKEKLKLSDPDLSYSDRDEFSNDSDQSDTILTKATAPTTVASAVSIQCTQTSNDEYTEVNTNTETHRRSDHILHKVLPNEIQYQSKQNDMKECIHTNNITSDDEDDIRNSTLTNGIEPSTLTSGNGWQDITGKTRKSVSLKHAVISPAKPDMKHYNKKSPNFNKYDPEGSIIRRSNRIKQQTSKNNHQEDHSPRRTRSSKKSGQGP
jgi:hypothetical protein